MKKALMVWLVLALGAFTQAQDFSFGAALGFFGVGRGGLGFSVPLELHLLEVEGINLNLRADVALVLGQPLGLTALISPMLSYTFLAVDFLPLRLYGGPSLRLLVQSAFEDSRSYAWSFLGGLAGASLSLSGFLQVFAEANLNLLGNAPVVSIQSGLRF